MNVNPLVPTPMDVVATLVGLVLTVMVLSVLVAMIFGNVCLSGCGRRVVLVPPGEPVLGIVFDGTGYGTDGTIWGGELLLGSYGAVRRVGHLRPVQLPGGDAAIAHPARVAIAHLIAAGIDPAATASAAAMSAAELGVLQRMVATGSHCTPTTSMGRLFDAVASLLDVRHSVDYEAQAAIELEALAAGVHGEPWQARVLPTPDGVVIDPTGWLAAAVGSDSPAAAAASFHAGLADAVARSVALLRQRYDFTAVGLTGGVFANALLTSHVLQRLTDVPVLLHRIVPPNDGGLALGQVCIAAAPGDPGVG